MLQEKTERLNDDPALQEAIAQGVNIGMTFTSRELLGKQMTLAEVIKLIEPMDRASCLILLSNLNWYCTWVEFTSKDRWREATNELETLINQFLPPSLRLKARLIANNDKFAGPVSEIALLSLAGLVCRFSRKVGSALAHTQSAYRDLFHALLGVQGGITGKSPDLWHIDEVFPRTTQIIWRNISLQNMIARDLARLHAYLTIREIGSGLQETVSQWFERHLGVTGEDYEAIANSLHGAISLGEDFRALIHRFPKLEKPMSQLLKLCSTTVDDLASSMSGQLKLESSDADAINEAQRLADEFFRTPVLLIGGRMVSMSSRLFFNRLHRGLHYLVAEQYQGDAANIKKVRAECGNLFERYILWLLKQFLPDNVEIIHSFRIKPPGKRKRGNAPPERDIAVIAGKRAFLFEIKSAIPNFAHRRRAEVTDFVNLLGKAVKQVVSGADALLSRTAFRDVDLTIPLPRVETVVPCVVCFEPLPLRFPVAIEFEDAISEELKNHPFEQVSGRLPVQLFDVEGIESFGDLFSLPCEWELLLSALSKRSSNKHIRYKPLGGKSGLPESGNQEGSLALPKLCAEAEKVSSKRWRELTAVKD